MTNQERKNGLDTSSPYYASVVFKLQRAQSMGCDVCIVSHAESEWLKSQGVDVVYDPDFFKATLGDTK
jgi:hypothetical protein